MIRREKCGNLSPKFELQYLPDTWSGNYGMECKPPVLTLFHLCLLSKACTNLGSKSCPLYTYGPGIRPLIKVARFSQSLSLIADLTGNIPLVLEDIGAIFRFPDAPTPEMVIRLGENIYFVLEHR